MFHSSLSWTRPRLASILLVLTLVASATLASFAPAAAQDDALDASTLTLNVEFILDASGSMAEAIPGTDQSRMDAAKTAMRDVIHGIPERDGLNIGFRLYGHKGSNSEADREVSCAASELLVPIDGFDSEHLLAEMDTAKPTGWTPLALSLEKAAADFSSGGESVTNAIIMVTDGEDTCGGDPCAVSGALHQADIAVTTHVVGLALSPEQQNAVGCIAEEGGGELFTADNAESLSDAVFSALSQVDATPEPARAELETETGGYAGGNAFSVLDAGTDGELTVVAAGAYDGTRVPVVVRNATGEDVQEIQITAIARSGGKLIASGADEGINPHVVVAGGLAFGDVYFGEELPDDVEFEFELSAVPANEDDASELDLTLQEVEGDGTSIVGIFVNEHDIPVGDPTISTYVACFDETGTLLDAGFGPAVKSVVEPGATTPFEFGFPSASNALETESCPVFLVAADGNTWD